MKKLLLGITILAFVLVATSAMAQTAKAPKSLCFTYSTGYSQNLALKSIGTVSTSGEKVKMYTVIGNSFSGYDSPIHGSGYVVPGTTTFHATLNRMGGAGSYSVTSYELSYNLGANTGTLYVRYDRSDGTIDPFTFTISPTDCSTLSTPTVITTSEANRTDDL